MAERKVRLPITLEEFDKLVDKVVKKFKLTDVHHAAAIISVTIRQLPNNEIYTTMEHLGHSVLKNIANYVAKHKADSMQHASQISALENLLMNDPNNFQARDELQKAANEGSELAKTALEKYNQATA